MCCLISATLPPLTKQQCEIITISRGMFTFRRIAQERGNVHMTAKTVALTFGYNFHNRIIQLSTRCNIRMTPFPKKRKRNGKETISSVNWLIGVVSTCPTFRILVFLWFCCRVHLESAITAFLGCCGIFVVAG